MKLTKSQLRRIIKEELGKIIEAAPTDAFGDTEGEKYWGKAAELGGESGELPDLGTSSTSARDALIAIGALALQSGMSKEEVLEALTQGL
jgi:hypothetical protein